MGDYRPITDVWILARPKVAYYGAFPSGYLERARALLGVNYLDPVLHVCAGRVRDYPFFGFGPNDKTLDANPELSPDFLALAQDPYPRCNGAAQYLVSDHHYWREDAQPMTTIDVICQGWPAIHIDRPYTPEDHAQYAVADMGVELPDLSVLLKNGLDAVRMYGRVGVLDYLWPRPKDGEGYTVKAVAKVSVTCGFGNRDRCYAVYEKRPRT